MAIPPTARPWNINLIIMRSRVLIQRITLTAPCHFILCYNLTAPSTCFLQTRSNCWKKLFPNSKLKKLSDQKSELKSLILNSTLYTYLYYRHGRTKNSDWVPNSDFVRINVFTLICGDIMAVIEFLGRCLYHLKTKKKN